MATGVVSGVVADLLQKSPSLTPDQVKARLMLTAYKTFPASSSTTDPTTGITYTDQYDVFTIGAGYVDVEAALNSTAVAKGTAMSPIATFNSTTNEVHLYRRSLGGLEHFCHMVERGGVGLFAVRARHLGSVERRYIKQQRTVGQQCPVGLQRVVGQRCSVGYPNALWGSECVVG